MIYIYNIYLIYNIYINMQYKYIYIYIYIHHIHHVPKFMSSHKAIVVITRMAHCSHDNLWTKIYLL